VHLVLSPLPKSSDRRSGKCRKCERKGLDFGNVWRRASCGTPDVGAVSGAIAKLQPGDETAKDALGSQDVDMAEQSSKRSICRNK
jgi:hypothetical protein